MALPTDIEGRFVVREIPPVEFLGGPDGLMDYQKKVSALDIPLCGECGETTRRRGQFWDQTRSRWLCARDAVSRALDMEAMIDAIRRGEPYVGRTDSRQDSGRHLR